MELINSTADVGGALCHSAGPKQWMVAHVAIFPQSEHSNVHEETNGIGHLNE